jgi:hypothetical protein
MLLLGGIASAQNASISGTVQDSSGAAVSSASVTITNLATTVARHATTNGTGLYRIEPLSPGDYSLTIEKDGFKSVNVDKLTLTVDQKFTFNTALEVGGVSTKVEVNADSVGAVDTETATLSNVIDQKQMAELPLILRDPYQLVLLGPGVTQSDGVGGVSVNGGRERNNNFQLDGVDNNDTDVPGNLGGLTTQNPDSTEEFRVLTNNFAPEYGRNNGAIIDVVTKSGTNDFHGSVYYYGRWDALGARDFFNHQVDPLTNKVAVKNPYVRNLYGVAIGGPIIKGKTFFFLNYQGDRFVTSLSNSATVPTAAFKSGNFTYVNPTDGKAIPINVTVPGANQNATGVGLDPVIQKILSLYPAPNTLNSDNVSGQLIFPSESREKDEDATVKIDHAISKNNNLSVRYIYNWFNDPNPFHSDFLPGNLGAISSPQRSQGLAVSLISTPTATLSHELRLGANRANLFFGCTGTGVFNSFGLVDSEGRGADYTLPGFTGVPGGSGFGCQGLGDTNAQDSKQGTYSILDTLTKVKGSHTFKLGGEYRRVYSNNYTSFSSRQTLTFNIFSGFNIPTLTNLPEQVPNLIQDEVSALLGLVNQASQTQFFNSKNDRLKNDAYGFRQRELAFFGQDVWKVRPNLSVTYGLRWEWYGVPFEQNNNLSNLFQNPAGVAPTVDSSNCAGATPCTGFTFQKVGPNTGLQLYNDYYRNFEPRLGFAWDPFHDGKTSIRGGIGVFSDRIYGNLVEDARGNPPFQPSYFNFPSFFNGPVTAAQVSSQTAPPILTPNPVVVSGTGLFPDLFAHNMKPPLIVTWNFGIQREIKNVTVEANYVGNHGTRIIRVVDGNPPQPAQVSQNLQNCIAGGNPKIACESDLQFANLYFGGALNPPSANNNAFFHTFTDETTGYSYYNGLQTQATLRPTHGLQLSMAYTWSHAIDNSSDPLVTTLGNGNYPVDSFNVERERGNSGFDTRQRAVLNFIYQLGVGRGQKYLNEGFIGKVFEGWQLSGIAQWQTGLPYDIFGFVDTLHTGIADRASVVNASALKVLPSTGKIYPGGAGYFTGFNSAAFNNDITNPPFDVPSSLVRNAFYGPGINNWDLNFAKTTKITERVSFQLRWEIYNVFNRPHFAKPDNTIGDTLFGYSTSQVGQNDGTTGARQMQIGGRLIF